MPVERGNYGSDSVGGTMPKSVLRGHKCQVGDVLHMKITGIYDDEVAMEYVGKMKKGEGKETGMESEEGEATEQEQPTSSPSYPMMEGAGESDMGGRY